MRKIALGRSFLGPCHFDDLPHAILLRAFMGKGADVTGIEPQALLKALGDFESACQLRVFQQDN
jgi:hypothetical protein